MTIARTDEHGDPIYLCARHPETETALQCGRCETPICPRCMIHTPGGIRCPDCAKLRRPPMYELAASDYAKAACVALALIPVIGFLGALLIPVRGFGGFFIFIGLFLGSGLGALVGEAINRSTNGKRGTAMQAIAAATLVGAMLVRWWLSANSVEAALSDIVGFVVLGVGIAAAWSRLR